MALFSKAALAGRLFCPPAPPALRGGFYAPPLPPSIGGLFLVTGECPALWAGRGLPSAPSGRVPPAPCGLRAATPAHPGRLGRRPPRPPAAVGELWRLVAACGGSGLRPFGACQPPAVARGHPVGPQGQAPFGGRFAGLAPRQPRAGCGVGAPGRPAPTKWGLWGGAALRPGRRRSGQPRQRGHRLRRQAVPLGSASALAARRSGPARLRRPAAESRAGSARRSPAAPRPGPCPSRAARPVRGRNLGRRAQSPCPLSRVAAPRRFARGWGAAPVPQPALRGGEQMRRNLSRPSKPPAAGLDRIRRICWGRDKGVEPP